MGVDGVVRFNVNGTDHPDEFTRFDPLPPQIIPATGWTLLSNRDLVNRAILDWKTNNHVGTDLSVGFAAGLLGGHYALLAAAWALGFAIFLFFAALLWGYEMGDIVISAIVYMAGGAALAGIIGLVIGMVSAVDCHEKGDRDMSLMGLFPLIYRYGKLLDEKSYDHILHVLLRKHTSGGASNVHEVVHVCDKKILFPAIGETENHILMIETSRFLTNQLLLQPNPHTVPIVPAFYDAGYDNAKNGMREWMLKQLQQYLQNDFWEFNSRSYARFIPVALQNLYEFSADPEVSKAARMVLDYLSAKFAVTSNGSRRAVPFRRTADNRAVSGLFEGKPEQKQSDVETWRFLILAGDVYMLGHVPKEHEEAVLIYHSYTMVFAALGRYRVPKLILDLILMKGSNRYLQRIRHGKWNHGYGDAAAEITFNSATYLITGGGMFTEGRQWPMPDEDREHSWALPTTLMPTAGGVDVYGEQRNTDWKDFIRIEGTADEKKRANTGVAPGFACGLNPVIPQWMLLPAGANCIRQDIKPWTFINCATMDCGRPLGFYVAVFKAPCDTALSTELAGEDGTFGFLAAAEIVRPNYKFEEFVADVIALNGSKSYTAEGTNNFAFPTGFGPQIEFVCVPTKKGDYERLLWPIVKINGESFERDIDRWDLATSEVFKPDGIRTSLEDFVIRSEKHYGCVMIDNPKLDERLVLDLSDALNPKSAYVKGQRFDSGCRCPLSTECERKHPIK